MWFIFLAVARRQALQRNLEELGEASCSMCVGSGRFRVGLRLWRPMWVSCLRREQRVCDCVSQPCLSVSQEDWPGWACSYRGEGAAVSPVKKKRGMFHHFCGCRVALSLLFSIRSWSGLIQAFFYSLSVAYILLGTTWPRCQQAAFSPGFMCTYLSPLVEGKDGIHILEECQG